MGCSAPSLSPPRASRSAGGKPPKSDFDWPLKPVTKLIPPSSTPTTPTSYKQLASSSASFPVSDAPDPGQGHAAWILHIRESTLTGMLRRRSRTRVHFLAVRQKLICSCWLGFTTHYVHSRGGPFSRFQLVPTHPGLVYTRVASRPGSITRLDQLAALIGRLIGSSRKQEGLCLSVFLFLSFILTRTPPVTPIAHPCYGEHQAFQRALGPSAD